MFFFFFKKSLSRNCHIHTRGQNSNGARTQLKVPRLCIYTHIHTYFFIFIYTHEHLCWVTNWDTDRVISYFIVLKLGEHYCLHPCRETVIFFFLITELNSIPQVSHYWYWCFCFLGGTLARLLYFATGNNTSIKPLCLGLHLRTQEIWREIALKDPNSTRSNYETLGEWPLFGDAGTISGCRGNQDSRKLLLSPPEGKVGLMEPRSGVHRSCEHSIQGQREQGRWPPTLLSSYPVVSYWSHS